MTSFKTKGIFKKVLNRMDYCIVMCEFVSDAPYQILLEQGSCIYEIAFI